MLRELKLSFFRALNYMRNHFVSKNSCDSKGARRKLPRRGLQCFDLTFN